MNRSLIAVASLAALLGACSEQNKAPAPPSAASAEPEPMVLGLKVSQFEGSNLLSTNGSDLGNVVRVDVNSEGKATGFIIAPTGPGQRWVRLPLAGLTIKVDGPYNDVVTPLTWEEVKALPGWTP